ncbi:MAG: acyl-CoA dehydrogenase, partial [Cytophagales bacterium]|nr:acyl-CoA dehydrogenase [Cytophagales bacterium]
MMFQTPRLQQLLPAVRAFVNDELVPLEPPFMHGSFAEIEPVLQEKRQRVKSLGWWTPHLAP